MKRILSLFLPVLFFLSAQGQTQRVINMPGFQQLGTPSTQTRINGVLYPQVGYAPALYTDTGTANANSYLKNIPFAQISTSSDGKNWYRNADATKWNEFGGGGATPTLQQVLTAGSTLTTDNTIGGGGNTLNINNLWGLYIEAGNGRGIVMDDEDGQPYEVKIYQTVNSANESSVELSESSVVLRTLKDLRENDLFVKNDSIFFKPSLGQMNIDSLRTWSGISDTTYKKPMTWDTRNGRWEYAANWYGGGGSTLPISSLTAATGTNSINNGDYQQTWNWNSLSGYGFVVQSSATTASNGSRLFYVLRSGTNANAGVTSYSGYFSNSHIGTSSTNIAGLFSAQSGTNNYAIIVPSGGGSVGIGTTTPNASALLDVTSTTQGAVLPRMNTTQMNAIASPVAGLMVYNSDSLGYCFYNGTAWLKMGSGSGATSPGGSTKQFQYNNAGSFAGSSMLTQETDQILITGNSAASTPPFEVNAHEDLTAEIINVKQSGSKKFSFHSNGSIEMAKSSLPSTPAGGYLRLTVNSDNSKLYTTNDAGVSAMLVQDLQLKFGAGSGADADTTAFTTTALYGDYYTTDTIKVTSLRIVMQGTSPSVTVKIFYNDSLGVQAGATALVTAGNAVTNTTTGTNITSFDVSTIPPNVYVWAVTSTVGTKPKYLSIQLNGYRK